MQSMYHLCYTCMSTENSLSVMWTWSKWAVDRLSDSVFMISSALYFSDSYMGFSPSLTQSPFPSVSFRSPMLFPTPWNDYLMRYCHKVTYFYPLIVLVKMINYENDFVEQLIVPGKGRYDLLRAEARQNNSYKYFIIFYNS